MKSNFYVCSTQQGVCLCLRKPFHLKVLQSLERQSHEHGHIQHPHILQKPACFHRQYILKRRQTAANTHSVT